MCMMKISEISSPSNAWRSLVIPAQASHDSFSCPPSAGHHMQAASESHQDIDPSMNPRRGSHLAQRGVQAEVSRARLHHLLKLRAALCAEARILPVLLQAVLDPRTACTAVRGSAHTPCHTQPVAKPQPAPALHNGWHCIYAWPPGMEKELALAHRLIQNINCEVSTDYMCSLDFR